VHFVTTLEEMPVQETLDGLAELHALAGGAIAPGGIFVNMVRPALLSPAQLSDVVAGTLDVAQLTDGLKALGLGDVDHLPTNLALELRDHALQVSAQDRVRATLEAVGRPMYELTAVTEGIDLAGLYDLAAELREQGAA